MKTLIKNFNLVYAVFNVFFWFFVLVVLTSLFLNGYKSIQFKKEPIKYSEQLEKK